MLPFFLFVVLSFISLVRDGLSLGDKAQITLPMVWQLGKRAPFTTCKTFYL